MLLLLASLHRVTAQSSQSSLESFTAFAGVSEFTSTPDGQALAWVLNDRGLRNVFVRRNGNTTQLTTYTVDDGQEITGLTFAPDGNTLWYIRGGAPNVNGESPNPASLASGADRAIWRIPVTGGSPERVVAAGGFVFTRSGRHILYTKGSMLMEAEAKPGTVGTPLFSARGATTAFRESADGHEVLFTSDRGDHAFTGIYNRDSRSIRWIDAQVFRDQMPVWSPDGQSIAFIRTPGFRNDQMSNLTSGYAFSIVVADAKTGSSRVIWTSPAGMGGHAQSYPHPVFAWHASNRILFFSEHTGWTHIWSIRPDGSDLRDLTPGDGEVESYTEAPDNTSLYFDTNIGDIDRRHIWRTHVVSGNPKPVTLGEGIEMYPMFAGKTAYCLRSTMSTHKQPVSIPADGISFSPLTANSSDFKPQNFLKPEQVVFKAADGTTVHGQLFIDRKARNRRPGILFMHGGPTRQMLLGFHYSDYYSYGYSFNQYLASQGYVVLSVNYRNGIGYGRAFRNSPDQGPRGAVEYQDIVAAGKYLQGLPEVMPDRIGLWGGSYGGYLTAMGLARNPELFKAGVDVHGVHDWAFRARTFWVPGGWWGITESEMDLAYKSSPVSDLSRWTAPVLLISGDDDRNVQFQETTDLAMRLMERKVPVETLVLPDEVHGFLRYASWTSIFRSAADFFSRNLPVR